MQARSKLQIAGQFIKPQGESAFNRKAAKRLDARRKDYQTTGKTAPNGAYHQPGSWKK